MSFKKTGIAYQNIPSSSNDPTSLTIPEIRGQLSKLIDRPVFMEHQQEEIKHSVGKIAKANLGIDGSGDDLLLEVHLFYQPVIDRVKKGEFPAFSLSHRPRTKEITSVSLVRRGWRPGTKIFEQPDRPVSYVGKTFPADVTIDCNEAQMLALQYRMELLEKLNSKPYITSNNNNNTNTMEQKVPENSEETRLAAAWDKLSKHEDQDVKDLLGFIGNQQSQYQFDKQIADNQRRVLADKYATSMLKVYGLDPADAKNKDQFEKIAKSAINDNRILQPLLDLEQQRPPADTDKLNTDKLTNNLKRPIVEDRQSEKRTKPNTVFAQMFAEHQQRNGGFSNLFSNPRNPFDALLMKAKNSEIHAGINNNEYNDNFNTYTKNASIVSNELREKFSYRPSIIEVASRPQTTIELFDQRKM